MSGIAWLTAITSTLWSKVSFTKGNMRGRTQNSCTSLSKLSITSFPGRSIGIRKEKLTKARMNISKSGLYHSRVVTGRQVTICSRSLIICRKITIIRLTFIKWWIFLRKTSWKATTKKSAHSPRRILIMKFRRLKCTISWTNRFTLMVNWMRIRITSWTIQAM